MAINRRFKKGSDSILQNSDKWNLIDESTQSVRSEYDFTQMEIPKLQAEDLQEEATLVNAPLEDTPATKPTNNKPKEPMRKPWIKHFDAYIMKKFLGTFVFAILLLLAIVVMFDINEKLDAMLTAPLKETIFKYFLNFLHLF